MIINVKILWHKLYTNFSQYWMLMIIPNCVFYIYKHNHIFMVSLLTFGKNKLSLLDWLSSAISENELLNPDKSSPNSIMH